MRQIHKLGIRLTGAAGLALMAGWTVSVTAADAQGLDAMIADLKQATSELGKFKQELPQKVQGSLSLKKKHEADLADVGRQIDALDAGEGKQIEAERSSVWATCHQTVTKEQMAAAEAQCNALLGPFNASVSAYNVKLRDFQQKAKDIATADEARVAEIKALSDQNDRLQSRVETLTKVVRAALAVSCAQSTGGNAEQAVYEQSKCWDRAKPGLAQLLGAPAPNFTMTPQRTPQEAIDEYKNSGAATPTTRSRKTTPPPPPPKP